MSIYLSIGFWKWKYNVTVPLGKMSSRYFFLACVLLHIYMYFLTLVVMSSYHLHFVTSPGVRLNSMVNLLGYFSFQPVLNDWYITKAVVCAIHLWHVAYIKDPLLLIEKSSPYSGSSGFSSLVITAVLYHITVNNVLIALLNKTFPSFCLSPLHPRKDNYSLLIEHSYVQSSPREAEGGWNELLIWVSILRKLLRFSPLWFISVRRGGLQDG